MGNRAEDRVGEDSRRERERIAEIGMGVGD
jgi:hypothetical protein